MAFPIPAHLPRQPAPQDVSSKILSKIGEATNATLNSALTSSWLQELEESIQVIKGRIRDRIQEDLPDFERQWASSKSVQTRLQTLTQGVDTLSDAVSNPETGLLPTLVGTLQKHAALAQQTSDALSKHEALSYLLKCRIACHEFTSLVKAGNLPEATNACSQLKTILDDPPDSVKKATIMESLLSKFCTTKALLEEQLSDAYSRSIVILPTAITIYPSVQVRQSDATVHLSSILESLSSESLSVYLSILRRDLTHVIDHVLTQATSLSVIESAISESQLTLTPTSPNTEILGSRVENVGRILQFISAHLISRLPLMDGKKFGLSLNGPLTASVLEKLLIPLLPSSFGLLPSFLELLQQAVSFEQTFLVDVLGQDGHDTAIKAWADDICRHYERQRRTQMLAHSRTLVTDPDYAGEKFRVEVNSVPDANPGPLPRQEEVGPASVERDDSWGFDESPVATTNGVDTDEVENGWGFSDPDPEPEAEESAEREREDMAKRDERHLENGNGVEHIEVEDPDPSEAWGWNDDETLAPEGEGKVEEELPWDDAWPEPESAALEPPAPVHPVTSPKVAARLEKLMSKQKKSMNGASPSKAPPSPQLSLHCLPTPPPPPPPPLPHLISHATSSHPKETGKNVDRRPSMIQASVPVREAYRVSGRTKHILKAVESAIDEGKQIASSCLFHAFGSGYSPGSVLLPSAASPLDVFRALYPVIFANDLEDPEKGVQFSNDCLYLSQEVQVLEQGLRGTGMDVLRQRLDGCRKALDILGDRWYNDTIRHQWQLVDEILTRGCQGFQYTSDQDRYDECESAIGQILRDIRGLAHKLKDVLPKGKYYTAVGLVTDAALSRILEDVLALPDIPEVESHRLSELCRILTALEGLFSEDPTEPSFVVAYVPSWLKFSYLSELLEASLADITYLFEEGALVDFDVDELVRLVRALFSDTALRTNTIRKIQAGHPAPSERDSDLHV